MTPQLQKQMQQQYQQAIVQEQAQMAAMAKQAQQVHQQRLQNFNGWVKNNSASSGQSQSGTLSQLPQSPGAFAGWYKKQKHNKALNKSYDPAYDQYREYEKTQQASRQHRNHSNTTATAQNSEFAAIDAGESTARAGRSIVAGPVVCAAIELGATDGCSDVGGSVDQPTPNADGSSIPDSGDDDAIECPEFVQSGSNSLVTRASSAQSSNPQQLPLSQMTPVQSTNPQQLPVARATNAQQLPLAQMTPAPSLNPQQLPVSLLTNVQQLPLTQITSTRCPSSNT